jgi:SPW repeat
MKRLRFDWIVLAAAVWLCISPLAFGTARLSNPATVLAWSCGIVLLLSGTEALTVPDVVDEWVDIVTGTVLVAGPWVLDFDGNAALATNSVAVGVLVTATAVVGLVRDRFAGRRAEARAGDRAHLS